MGPSLHCDKTAVGGKAFDGVEYRHVLDPLGVEPVVWDRVLKARRIQRIRRVEWHTGIERLNTKAINLVVTLQTRRPYRMPMQHVDIGRLIPGINLQWRWRRLNSSGGRLGGRRRKQRS